MWHLTSTSQVLRDAASGALYWYGRGTPNLIFSETVKSFQINDLYISERLLAISYGIAMAKHVENESPNFRNNIFPQFAKQIFENIFAREIGFNNSHMFLRGYAFRLIMLALKYHPELLSSQEAQLLQKSVRIGNIVNGQRVKMRVKFIFPAKNLHLTMTSRTTRLEG